MDEWKRSGQIPAFGNWDMANELPITQYFECARQVRYSSSSGESDRDLYALDFKKPLPPIHPSLLKKTRRNRETRLARVKENVKRQGRVWDVREGEGPSNTKPIRKQLHNPKPVDEDLYKIPPELLHSTKRNKMLGFISKCLLPTGCVS